MRAPILFIFFLLANLPPSEVAATEPGDESWSSAYHLPGVAGNVYSLTSRPEGVYLCGAFTALGSLDVQAIALLTDDGDTLGVQEFGTGLVSAWGKVVEFDGHLVVSGRTVASDGSDLYGAFVFDGTSWSVLGDSLYHSTDLAIYRGELYRAGPATSVDPYSVPWQVWRWTGSDWDPIITPDEYAVRLLVHDDLMYVTGLFTTANGDSVTNMLVWDGMNASSVGGLSPGYPAPMVIWEDELVVAGAERRNEGWVRTWDGSTWTDLFHVPRQVDGLGVWSGQLVAATDSLYDVHMSTRHDPDVLVYDGADWTSLGKVATDLLAPLGDTLLMGNDDPFGMAEDVIAPELVMYRNGTLESPFPGGLGFDDTEMCLETSGDHLLVGGSFYYGGGVPMTVTGAFDGVAWSARDSFDVGLEWFQEVRTLESLAAVGELQFAFLYSTYLDTGWAYSFIKRDPAPPANGVWEKPYWGIRPFHYLQPLGDRLFAWTQSGIKEINPDNGYYFDISPLVINGSILATCAAESSLVLAGDFTLRDGHPTSNIIRFDDPGWSDFAPGLPGTVEAVLDLPDGGLAAAWNADGTRRVATWDGSAWSHLTGDFDGPIHALAWHQERLVAGGHFTHIGPYAAAGISVWDGAGWARLGSGLDDWEDLDGTVEMASTSHGLYVAGAMKTAGGHRTSGLAVWTGDLRLITGPAPVSEDIPPTRGTVALNAHPNPFNPRTTISWDLPAPGTVDLGVYDLMGRRVRSLLNGYRPAGPDRTSWDGLLDDGRPAPSGIYHLRLEWSGGTASRKLTLVR